MVSGDILNGTLTWSGWATYFLEHRANLPYLLGDRPEPIESRDQRGV